VPVSTASVAGFLVSVVDSEDGRLRKALISARTGLSPTRRRTRSIRAVRSKDPNEATTHYPSRGAGLSSGGRPGAGTRSRTRLSRCSVECTARVRKHPFTPRGRAEGQGRRPDGGGDFAESSGSDGGNAFEAGRGVGMRAPCHPGLGGARGCGSRGLIASRSRGRAGAAALIARWSPFPACRATGR
jgi:hypothetical protein